MQNVIIFIFFYLCLYLLILLFLFTLNNLPGTPWSIVKDLLKEKKPFCVKFNT